MAKNEKTSKRVAAIAGRVMAIIDAHKKDGRSDDECLEHLYGNISLAELKTLAASCLTQAPDKPKKKGK